MDRVKHQERQIGDAVYYLSPFSRYSVRKSTIVKKGPVPTDFLKDIELTLADGLFLNSNKFYYSTGKTTIKAFRGWFELDAVLNQETDFGVKMVIDGFETKVEGVSVKDAAGAIYDLSGRKMNAPTHRGVYIIGGKKVVINK